MSVCLNIRIVTVLQKSPILKRDIRFNGGSSQDKFEFSVLGDFGVK